MFVVEFGFSKIVCFYIGEEFEPWTDGIVFEIEEPEWREIKVHWYFQPIERVG